MIWYNAVIHETHMSSIVVVPHVWIGGWAVVSHVTQRDARNATASTKQSLLLFLSSSSLCLFYKETMLVLQAFRRLSRRVSKRSPTNNDTSNALTVAIVRDGLEEVSKRTVVTFFALQRNLISNDFICCYVILQSYSAYQSSYKCNPISYWRPPLSFKHLCCIQQPHEFHQVHQNRSSSNPCELWNVSDIHGTI